METRYGQEENLFGSQIIDVVNEVEGEAKLTEVARRVGFTVQTLARSRMKYSRVPIARSTLGDWVGAGGRRARAHCERDGGGIRW